MHLPFEERLMGEGLEVRPPPHLPKNVASGESVLVMNFTVRTFSLVLHVACLVLIVRPKVPVTLTGPLVMVTVAPIRYVDVFTLTVLVVRSGVLTLVLIIIGTLVRLTTTRRNLPARSFPPALTGVFSGTIAVVFVLLSRPYSIGLVR